MSDRIYVNIYDTGRVKGGNEEGGWWYDVGTPIGSIPVELTSEEREALHDAFTQEHGENWWFGEEATATWKQALEDALREKAWPIRDEWAEKYATTKARYSVLGGQDYDVLIEDHFARPFPEERPRYE